MDAILAEKLKKIKHNNREAGDRGGPLFLYF